MSKKNEYEESANTGELTENVEIGNEAEEKAQMQTLNANEAAQKPIMRTLKVTKPLMRGEDVRRVHELLAAHRLKCGNDIEKGIYGAATAYAVRMYQGQNKLHVTGCVDKATAAALSGQN